MSWFANFIFHLIGWKLTGRYPNELNKKILVVAPHTSSWDVVVGLLVKFWLKIDAAFYAKQELFSGIIGWVLKNLGARPVDRSQSNNLVDQVVHDFNTHEKHNIVITPEGTRKKVNQFRSGFYYMAHKANVPIIPIAFDYEHKTVIIMDPYYVTGDADKEIREIENLFRGIKGKQAANSFG